MLDQDKAEPVIDSTTKADMPKLAEPSDDAKATRAVFTELAVPKLDFETEAQRQEYVRRQKAMGDELAAALFQIERMPDKVNRTKTAFAVAPALAELGDVVLGAERAELQQNT